MNFRKIFRYSHATQQLIEYLKDGILNLEVWGRQLLKSGYSIPKNLSSDKGPSKQMLQEELAKHGYELMNGFKMNGRVIDPNKQSIIVELLLMKKQQARMHQRIVMISPWCFTPKLIMIVSFQRTTLKSWLILPKSRNAALFPCPFSRSSFSRPPPNRPIQFYRKCSMVRGNG